MEQDIKRQERDFEYVYFIENHEVSEKVQIDFSKKYSEANELIEVFQNEYKLNENLTYKYSIYRFNFYPSKMNQKEAKKEIIIKLENKNRNKFNGTITISNDSENIYIFDFKFDKMKNSMNEIEPPNSYKFSHMKQFDIYLDYIKNILKIKKTYSSEIFGLVSSTQNLFKGNDKKFLFSFYLKVLLASFKNQYFKAHLDTFKLNKIQEIGIIPKNIEKILPNILNIFEKKFEKLLEIIKEKNDEYGKKLFSIILYYNYNFKPKRMEEVIKNEKAKSYIYKILNEFYYLFKNLILTNDQLIDLLKYSNNLLEFIRIISNNFDKFYGMYEAEKISHQKSLVIDIDSIITLDKNDNLKEIYEEYNKLIEKQLDQKSKKIFLFIPLNLCEKYVNILKGENIDNLYHLKNIIKLNIDKGILKQKDIKFDILNIIHDTGITLSKNKRLKNIDILNAIENDKYYKENRFKRKVYRSLDILNGLNIKSFDEEFYKKWKKMDWLNIFDEQYYDFLSKVIFLIEDIKDFNILFKLFDKSKDENEPPNFDENSLSLMQKRFIELQKNNNSKESTNFKEDLKKLLFYSDQKEVDISGFLNSDLTKILSYESFYMIYIDFINTYKDSITSNIKQIITNYFIHNINPQTLLDLLEKCPYISKNILQNIDKYNIQKEDFMKFEKNDNLRVFEGLLNGGYIENELYKNINYIFYANKVLEDLDNDIKEGKISYRDISIFYSKKEEKLISRLKIIAKNKEEIAKNYFSIIDKYYNEIQNVFNDLQIILEDLFLFFFNKESEEIDKIKDIIEDMKNGLLNCYESKYVDKIKEIKKKYLKDAQIRNSKKKSSFFINIFNDNKIIYKNDDECIKKTEEDFEKIKYIFNKEELRDTNVLKIYLNTIQGKKDDEIYNEIEYLIEIFKDKIKNEYNKEEIKKRMKLLSKKEILYNISLAILLFIEKIQVAHDILWDKVSNIIQLLEKSLEEETIRQSIDELKKEPYNIDIDLLNKKNVNESNYLTILLMLKKQPEAIEFLMRLKIKDCRNLQEIVGEKDNEFLNANDILELEKCIEFMNILGKSDIDNFKNKKDIEIFNLFREQVKVNNNIELYFTRYVNNYAEIKNAFKKLKKILKK